MKIFTLANMSLHTSYTGSCGVGSNNDAHYSILGKQNFHRCPRSLRGKKNSLFQLRGCAYRSTVHKADWLIVQETALVRCVN